MNNDILLLSQFVIASGVAMRKLIVLFFLSFTYSYAAETGTIQCDPGFDGHIPVWTAPGSAYIIEQLNCSQLVSVAGLEKGFIKIQLADNFGYVNAKYVRLPQIKEQWKTQPEENAKELQQPPLSAAAAAQPAHVISALVEENRSITADQTKKQVLEESKTVKFGTSQQKPRVFITDSQSWEMKSSAVFSDSGGVAYSKGGARPQNAEIAKTFEDRCPQVMVTINQGKADYIVTLDHEGGKGLTRKDNKWVAYNKDGDMIGSGSTRSLGNSVKNACEAISKDRGGNP
jgi:hypothetical protein